MLQGSWADYDITFSGGAYTFTRSNGDTVRTTAFEFARFGSSPNVAIASVLNDAPVAVADSGFTLLEDDTLHPAGHPSGQ